LFCYFSHQVLFFSFLLSSSFFLHSIHPFVPKIIPLPMSLRRLKNKCKCDRSEDGEDEENQARELSKDVEKKAEVAEGLAVEGNENPLTRTPCHDSGIDIRDSLPTVPIIPTKKVRMHAKMDLQRCGSFLRRLLNRFY
jgi:hypothetical protein